MCSILNFENQDKVPNSETIKNSIQKLVETNVKHSFLFIVYLSSFFEWLMELTILDLQWLIIGVLDFSHNYISSIFQKY